MAPATPPAGAAQDEFETPPGPQADQLLPLPPAIVLSGPTPDDAFARIVPEAVVLAGENGEEEKAGDEVEREPPKTPGHPGRTGTMDTLGAPVGGRRLSLSVGDAVASLERRRSSLSGSMEFQVARRGSTASSLPSFISRISRVDEYKLLGDQHKLGGGATAKVMPAVFKLTNTPCAVKMLYKDGYNARYVDVRSQWKDEISFMKMVDRHPNVVTVLDAWRTQSFTTRSWSWRSEGTFRAWSKSKGRSRSSKRPPSWPCSSTWSTM